MAQVRERDNLSSPRSSSGGAESFKGTPDTRLTAFSPDNGSSRSSKFLQGLARSGSATPPGGLPASSFGNNTNTAHLDKDPFVTPSHHHGTRLSPTASAFSPFAGTVESPPLSEYGPVAAALSHELGLSRHLEISAHNSVSVSEVSIWLTVRVAPTLLRSNTAFQLTCLLAGNGSSWEASSRNSVSQYL